MTRILRIGDIGPEVRAWQQAIVDRGYKLVVDGDFGPKTHNATLAFQAAHGLLSLRDAEPGVVGPNELQILHAPPTSSVRPPPMLPHSIPLMQGRHFAKDAKGKPIARAAVDLIVLHCIECPEATTRAESTALWMANLSDRESKKSCGYFVDSDSVVQGMPDHWIAYHAAGANHNSIGIEHTGYARQTREEWIDDFGRRMLSLSMQLSARLCRQWKIPPVFVRAADLRVRKRGITTHAEVSKAFGRSDHWDPGPGFPIEWYCEGVAELLAAPLGAV